MAGLWRPPVSSRDPGIECVFDSNRSYVLEVGPITTVLTNYPTDLIGARICKFQERESYLNVEFLAESLILLQILFAIDDFRKQTLLQQLSARAQKRKFSLL